MQQRALCEAGEWELLQRGGRCVRQESGKCSRREGGCEGNRRRGPSTQWFRGANKVPAFAAFCEKWCQHSCFT
eukprot:450016-Pelagomonas_calceolata.AAC.1